MSLPPTDADPFQPTEREVRAWARALDVADLLLAELDLRLSDLVARIARSPLGARMLFKGGTALNKLYFGTNSRLSVDLDFNMLGDEAEVYARRKETRLQLDALATFAGLEVRKYTTGKASDHYLYDYPSVIAGTRQRLKVELSFGERFAVLGPVQRDLAAPSDRARGAPALVPVQTATLTELIATKIRALHQRRKGRDLFDLRMAMEQIEEPSVLRKLVLYYFAAAGKPFEPAFFLRSLDEKLTDPRFRDDLANFLKPGTRFDWDADAPRVRAWLADVMTLDESDAEFQLAVRHLCGHGGKAFVEAAASIPRPLAHLFGATLADRLSAPALAMTAEELRRLITLAPPDAELGAAAE